MVIPTAGRCTMIGTHLSNYVIVMYGQSDANKGINYIYISQYNTDEKNNWQPVRVNVSFSFKLKISM